MHPRTARADAIEHPKLHIMLHNPMILTLLSLLAGGMALGTWLG